MADYVIRQSNQRGAQGATGPVVSLAANTIAGNNTSASAAATGLTASQVRDLIGSQASTSVSKTTYHTPATTAVFNGQTIDSGQTPTVTGVGIATTVSSSSGYIHDPTNTNTYIFVNSGSAIKRVEQQFRGVQGLIAICLAGDATNMIHVEFNSGSSTSCTYKKSSIGSDFYQPTVAETVVSSPDLNDSTTHVLTVEVDGDTVTAFVDDVVVGFWWDANVSTVVGNWYYVQITGVTANCKIYGFSSFDELPQFNTVTAGSITAALMQSQGYQFGRKSLAGFAPDSPFYCYTESGDIFRYVGSTNCKIQIEADGSGHPAHFIAKNALDVELYVGVGGSNGVINYQGTDVITFPVNGFVGGTYMQLLQFSTTGIVATSWPTSDPTGGKLWLKGGIVRHGTDSAATAAASIGLGVDDSVVFTELSVGTSGTDGYVRVWDETTSAYRTLNAVQINYLAGLVGPVMFEAYAAKTSAYTLTDSDHIINCTSGTFAVTLPTAVGRSGREFIVKNSGVGVVSINTTSSQTIDGVSSGTITLNQYDSYTFASNGANWMVI